MISIHALVKRATCTLRADMVVKQHFNPRPREEGDKTPILIKADQNISIHALVKRATRGL